jgi:predicted HTH transcriptional regulator
MFEEMEESFLRHPEFSAQGHEFRVILRNQPIFEGPSSEWKRIVDQLGLTTPQRRILLAHPEGFTNEDYREINSVDRDQAYKEIKEMVDSGVILAAPASGRGAVYKLSMDIHKTKAWLESRIPRIRSFLQENKFLKNADYRKLFGVTRVAAFQELRRLVVEGYLKIEGERRGARYILGPALRETKRPGNKL